MTKKDRIIYDYMLTHKDEYLTPTEIGTGCGKVYIVASSWCNASLKRLMKDGLVVVGAKGYYRAKGQNHSKDKQ